MCLIIAVEKETPPLCELEYANTINPDGIGIAWIGPGGMIQWHKGLGLPDLQTLVPYVPTPYVVHFRVATSGGVSSKLCHPFPISRNVTTEVEGRAKRVIFHNGIWFDWKEVLVKSLIATGRRLPLGPWSDTRAMAFLAHHYGEEILNLLDEKIVMLSSKGLKFFGHGWIVQDGRSYSNDLLSSIYSPTTAIMVPGKPNYSGTSNYTRVPDSPYRYNKTTNDFEDDEWWETIQKETDREYEAGIGLHQRMLEATKEIDKRIETTTYRGKKYLFENEGSE